MQQAFIYTSTPERSKTIKCTNCKKRRRSQPNWVALLDEGKTVAHYCPACLTNEENQ